jgi:hypothetical protein
MLKPLAKAGSKLALSQALKSSAARRVRNGLFALLVLGLLLAGLVLGVQAQVRGSDPMGPAGSDGSPSSVIGFQPNPPDPFGGE